MTDHRLYTTTEAAAELGIPKTTISTWRRRGQVVPVTWARGRGRGGISPVYSLEDLVALLPADHPARSDTP